MRPAYYELAFYSLRAPWPGVRGVNLPSGVFCPRERCMRDRSPARASSLPGNPVMEKALSQTFIAVLLRTPVLRVASPRQNARPCPTPMRLGGRHAVFMRQTCGVGSSGHGYRSK
eukprot:3221959-Pleurochrysis_carterae.AAC.2